MIVYHKIENLRFQKESLFLTIDGLLGISHKPELVEKHINTGINTTSE